MLRDFYSQNALKMVIWRLGCGGLRLDCWRARRGVQRLRMRWYGFRHWRAGWRWLGGCGARWVAGAQGSAASADAVVWLQELARRLELLGRVAGAELGECAGNVGREILVEFSLFSVEGVEVGDRETEAWCDRGNEQYNLGDFEGAIASWDKALE